MNGTISRKSKKVCIIGAGAAGLAAIRHISRSPELEGTVFEERGELGGVWLYQPKTEAGNESSHGPLYKNMRTNIPRQVMGFTDFPFPDAFSPHQKTSFPHHVEVLEFLRSYADHFQLRDHIKFHRRVVSVNPIFNEPAEVDFTSSAPRWLVTVQDMSSDLPLVEEFEFDAVLICNGHFSKPQMPTIENLKEYEGTVLHSKAYDDATPFVDKCVLLLGCGPSGVDICFELAEVASKVIVSNIKDPEKFSVPPNVRFVSKIKSATQTGFVCDDGELIPCDAVIFCTGYLFDFPFLSPECGVVLEKSQRISPLYRDMVHVKFTSLCFIGIQLRIIPFVLFDCQVRFCVKLFEGLVELPSPEIMLDEIAKEMKLRDSLNPYYPVSLSWSHLLGPRQWKYCEILADEAKFQPPNLVLLRGITENTNERRSKCTRVYKDDLIYVSDEESESFRCVEAPEIID